MNLNCPICTSKLSQSKVDIELPDNEKFEEYFCSFCIFPNGFPHSKVLIGIRNETIIYYYIFPYHAIEITGNKEENLCQVFVNTKYGRREAFKTNSFLEPEKFFKYIKYNVFT